MSIMKIIFAAAILIFFCTASHAQYAGTGGNTPNYQSVSGEFAQNWLKDYMAKNPRTITNVNNTSLWDWGNVPKGKELVGGKLVDNHTYYQDMTSNWLGDYFLNPYTSEPLDPAKYPGYYLPVYSSPNYTNPYLPMQQQPVIQFYS
jgi:hypothetical protein